MSLLDGSCPIEKALAVCSQTSSRDKHILCISLKYVPTQPRISRHSHTHAHPHTFVDTPRHGFDPATRGSVTSGRHIFERGVLHCLGDRRNRIMGNFHISNIRMPCRSEIGVRGRGQKELSASSARSRATIMSASALVAAAHTRGEGGSELLRISGGLLKLSKAIDHVVRFEAQTCRRLVARLAKLRFRVGIGTKSSSCGAKSLQHNTSTHMKRLFIAHTTDKYSKCSLIFVTQRVFYR